MCGLWKKVEAQVAVVPEDVEEGEPVKKLVAEGSIVYSSLDKFEVQFECRRPLGCVEPSWLRE